MTQPTKEELKQASEVSLHNAIHLFMTYYKDAEKHFEGKKL